MLARNLILVGIIVFLFAGVIIISVFTKSTEYVRSFGEEKVFCENQLSTSCLAKGQVPATWHMNNIKISESNFTSCAELTGKNEC